MPAAGHRRAMAENNVGRQLAAGVRLDNLCINTIRFLSVDAVQKANSGHPGMPMEAASIAYVLWTRFLMHNPENPDWPNRDRFVLSAGHGSMLLYSLLYLTGYGVSIDDIKNFRQWGSITPGHPEHGHTPGVEATTGPLGQGFGNGVGMAMAERFLSSLYNRPGHDIFGYNIYSLCSDGDMMEGISSEAASLAGHLGLGNLIYIYLDNRITIEGETSLAFSEDVGSRFRGYDWHVQRIEGNNLREIEDAVSAARDERKRPSLIIARTHIGYGSPNKQDKAEAHGAPLGEEEARLTKRNLGWPEEPAFHVPREALDHFRKALGRGKALEEDWKKRFEGYSLEYPDLAGEWKISLEIGLPDGWKESIPSFAPSQGRMATREASGKVLNALAQRIPTLFGGSADLAPSCDTHLKGIGDFSSKDYSGRNIHFGVREHAMGAILNGMALNKGVIPYGATFLVFSDYMRPSIRMAALMGLRVIYVFTHDSIGLGEDGPTHQPVEHLAALRAIPNLLVMRPSDAAETAVAWEVALERRDGPSALILTRQKVPILDRTLLAPAEMLAKGGYILSDAEDPQMIIIATGSEVSLALEAQKRLSDTGTRARVVSMPSMELFEMQPEDYRNLVLPSDIRARLAIEAASPFGWHRYVGTQGEIMGVTTFGASAPGDVLMEEYGFNIENVVLRARRLVK